jgi:hypothetical protein
MSCGRLSLRWEIILKQILVTYNCLLWRWTQYLPPRVHN